MNSGNEHLETSSYSDEELMAFAQQGARDAFAALYERYKRPVASFAYRMTLSAELAQDIVQQTFVSLFENLGRYEPRRKFSTFAYLVARHLCLDELKSARARRTVSARDGARPIVEGLQSRAPDARAGVETAEESARLQEAVGRLPGKLREVLILRFYQDLSYREIGDILSCPESTATSRMDYALKRLRKLLR